MLTNRPIIGLVRGESSRETKGAASRRSRWGWLSSLLLAGLVAWPCCLRGANTSPEYLLKAAFLYNFAKYVTWPTNVFESADSPLTIGVLGEDVFRGALEVFSGALEESLATKKVKGRKLIIKHLNAGEDLDGCQMLFISPSEKERVPKILSALEGKRILTVSDYGEFAQLGGMINLWIVGKSVRFDINVEAAEKGGLKISSKLAGLGRLVKTEETTRNR